MRLLQLLREAGATEIHMRVSAPPFIRPCYYGTDIDSCEHLIACKYSLDEICEQIGADSLGYLAVEDVVRLCGDDRKDVYCTACFSGNYPTELPTADKKHFYDQKISERKKKKEST